MKVLVAYESRTGKTKEAAAAIADAAKGSGHDVASKPLGDVTAGDVAGADAIFNTAEPKSPYYVADLETVHDGQYPVTRYYNLCVRTRGPALANGFITYMTSLDGQRIVREVPVSDHIIRYALALVRQTRVREPGVPEFVSDQLGWGAGPRAVQFLILGAKARALLQGRTHVTCEDIQKLAKPVLRHRLVLSFTAESEGIAADEVIDRLLAMTPTREDELTRDERFQKIFAS